MAYRTPTHVKEKFRAYPQRALILTTVVHESRAVEAHLTKPETLIGEKGAFYEYGRFSDPAGDWLIVHAITPAGNSDAGLVASKAFQEFGSFHALMFVGVAGSLKEDIPIGSVVVGDYVYNGHSAKVGDKETLSRPHRLVPARELLTAAQGIIFYVFPIRCDTMYISLSAPTFQRDYIIPSITTFDSGSRRKVISMYSLPSESLVILGNR